VGDQDLTDLFAGLALSGMLAKGPRSMDHTTLATEAYDIAESMVTERERRRLNVIITENNPENYGIASVSGISPRNTTTTTNHAPRTKKKQ